jgi:hypothetical protein
VPLYKSLHVANTQIAYEDKDTIIGSIPIVVAKCGSFLKDQGRYYLVDYACDRYVLMRVIIYAGLYVEGIFRKSGR